MKRNILILIVLLMSLAASGCASKKYVPSTSTTGTNPIASENLPENQNLPNNANNSAKIIVSEITNMTNSSNNLSNLEILSSNISDNTGNITSRLFNLDDLLNYEMQGIKNKFYLTSVDGQYNEKKYVILLINQNEDQKPREIGVDFSPAPEFNGRKINEVKAFGFFVFEEQMRRIKTTEGVILTQPNVALFDNSVNSNSNFDIKYQNIELEGCIVKISSTSEIRLSVQNNSKQSTSYRFECREIKNT